MSNSSNQQNTGASRAFATLLSSANADYIAELYARYLKQSGSVDASWQDFFSLLGDDERAVLAELSGASWGRHSPARVIGAADPDAPAPKKGAAAPAAAASAASPEQIANSVRAAALIQAWRTYGHFAATLDPLGIHPATGHPDLLPATHQLQSDTAVLVDGQPTTVGAVEQKFSAIYGGTTGYEFMHIERPVERAWWQDQIENNLAQQQWTVADKKKILADLSAAEGIEKYLATKFVGVKRFGLEGGESMMAAIEQTLSRGAELGVREVCFGMAHRGRLNVLTNTLGKSFTKLFAEFQGAPANPSDVPGSSDVKYHMGYSNDREIGGYKVHVTLSPNPSHLEFVNPVVEGKTRAKQFQRSAKKLPYNPQALKEVMPILIHGDAAFAGQGIVAETLMLSQLQGFKTGGTIHIIVNNQIGFTTNPEKSRSGPYSSDLAHMINCPIIHVNGDDPEAVVRAARVCMEYRQQFGRDVVLDIICYRRNGHNESLEPLFTQPVMYAKIKNQPTTRELYAAQLAREGSLTADECDGIWQAFNTKLDEAFAAATSYKPNKADWLEGQWIGIEAAPANDDRRGNTAVSIETLKTVGTKLASHGSIAVNSKIERQLAAKLTMMETGENIDWGTGEALAFGTLLLEGFPVRFTGQDVESGTFSHRHAVLTDQTDEDKTFEPLNNLGPDQKAFIEICNSPLSEAAVLGYEYGFAAAEPNTLTIWEAQFGDFVNGAQVLIDQFIASAEAKWLRMAGLVMLLPHGYEGQGPEHSSARLERFLQLAAEDNMQICNISTPANYYHALRRQMHRSFRKPLIIMEPKSLLRHKLAVSKLEDFGPGSSFHRVIGDTHGSLVADSQVRRVVLCSGKVYYDLYQAREDQKISDVAIVRVEQLYPFPHASIKAQLAKYSRADVVWCQEEPQNQGAWTFVDRKIEAVLTELGHVSKRATYAGRTEAAAPAVGALSRHTKEQTALLDAALGTSTAAKAKAL